MLEVGLSRECAQSWRIASPCVSPSNGMFATIRRAQVSDVQLLEEMHRRLSAESIYYRYLRSYKPTLEELEDLCSLVEEEGFVLVATVDEPGEKVIGIAYFCVEPQNPGSAEPAILVEDNYQGCGFGRQLLQHLCQHASMLGVTEFNCYTHPANSRVLSLIQGSGLRFERKYDQGMNRIRVWLNRNPENPISA